MWQASRGTPAAKEAEPTDARTRPEPARTDVADVLAAFKDVARVLSRADHGSWMQSDLTMAQVRALFTIFRDGPLPVSGVAHHLSVGLPTASHLVDCLVRAGLVARQTGTEDRRVVHCSATPKGADLVDRVAGAKSERMRALLSRLDEPTLDGLLRGLRALTREASSEEAPSHAGA